MTGATCLPSAAGVDEHGLDAYDQLPSRYPHGTPLVPRAAASILLSAPPGAWRLVARLPPAVSKVSRR